jgi:hypothetical protein
MKINVREECSLNFGLQLDYDELTKDLGSR